MGLCAASIHNNIREVLILAEKNHIETPDEARDRERSRALAFELRQIIQADRMAMDILSNAEDTRKDIVKKTGEETAAILADAKDKMAEATRQAERAHTEEMERRKKEADQAFAAQRWRLEEHFGQNREAWAEAITSAILTGGGKEEAGPS